MALMEKKENNSLSFNSLELNKEKSCAGKTNPLVAILMCTFNGSRFLSEQLNSIEDQDFSNWVVIVSDDGSTDATFEVLQEYQSKWPKGKLRIRTGPRKGFSINFQSLICDAHIVADYYSYCDQDDVWLPDKLSTAVKAISDLSLHEDGPSCLPVLYCGRSTYVSNSLESLGESQLFLYPKTFSNALVQNIAGGNTMVMNHHAKLLFEKVGIQDVYFHDWWSYLLISGANGGIIYDAIPKILYRQHEFAQVGEIRSIRYRLSRFLTIINGDLKNWNGKNLIALRLANQFICIENKEKIKLFEKMRSSRLIGRLRLLRICGIYRQTRRGEIALILAILIGKI